MLVLCPTCKTKYRVDENKIGPEGAKIRCAKCQTIFRVSRKPPAAQAPAPTPPAAAKPTPAPAAKAPAPFPPVAARPAAAPAVKATAPAVSELEITGPMMPKGMPKAELLLADADETFLNKIGEELIDAGYAVWYARDGETALRFIKEKRPPAAILEVMLPGLFGFEVCEKVKSDPDLSEVKLVLIGSVYEKNRFRRAPANLYGADEYVDKYHDGMEVLAKVEKVLGFAPPEKPAEQAGEETAPAPAGEIPPPRPTAVIKPPIAQPVPPRPPAPAAGPVFVPPQPVISKPLVQPTPQRPVPPPSPRPAAPPAAPPRVATVPVPPVAPKPAPAKPSAAVDDWTKSVPNDPDHQKAARLARTIASDIALYNPELVERGVREGNFWDLLAKDIDDGRKHYLSRVSPDIQANVDYFKLALDDLIAKRRKKLGLS